MALYQRTMLADSTGALNARQSHVMDGEVKEVLLVGGSPWGFSLKGGSEMRAALIVSKMESGGKANMEGSLCIGDVIIGINNVATESRTHAIKLVQASGPTLSITVRRVNEAPVKAPPSPPKYRPMWMSPEPAPSAQLVAKVDDTPSNEPIAMYQAPFSKPWTNDSRRDSPISSLPYRAATPDSNETKTLAFNDVRTSRDDVNTPTNVTSDVYGVTHAGHARANNVITRALGAKLGTYDDRTSPLARSGTLPDSRNSPVNLSAEHERNTLNIVQRSDTHDFTPVRRHNYENWHDVAKEHVSLPYMAQSRSSPNLSSDSVEDERWFRRFRTSSPSPPPPVPPRPRYLANQESAFSSLQYIAPHSRLSSLPTEPTSSNAASTKWQPRRAKPADSELKSVNYVAREPQLNSYLSKMPSEPKNYVQSRPQYDDGHSSPQESPYADRGHSELKYASPSVTPASANRPGDVHSDVSPSLSYSLESLLNPPSIQSLREHAQGTSSSTSSLYNQTILISKLTHDKMADKNEMTTSNGEKRRRAVPVYPKACYNTSTQTAEPISPSREDYFRGKVVVPNTKCAEAQANLSVLDEHDEASQSFGSKSVSTQSSDSCPTSPSVGEKSSLDVIDESPNTSGSSMLSYPSTVPVSGTNAPLLRRLSQEFNVQYKIEEDVKQKSSPPQLVAETTFPVLDSEPIKTVGKAGKSKSMKNPFDFRFMPSRASMRKAFGIFDEFNSNKQPADEKPFAEPKKKDKKHVKRLETEEKIDYSEPFDKPLKRSSSETFKPMKEKLREKEKAISNVPKDDFGFTPISPDRKSNRGETPTKHARQYGRDDKRGVHDLTSPSDDSSDHHSPASGGSRSSGVVRPGKLDLDANASPDKSAHTDKRFGRTTPTDKHGVTPPSDAKRRTPPSESKHSRSISLDISQVSNKEKRRSVGSARNWPHYGNSIDKLPSPIESHIGLHHYEAAPTRPARSQTDLNHDKEVSRAGHYHGNQQDTAPSTVAVRPPRYADVTRLSLSKEPDGFMGRTDNELSSRATRVSSVSPGQEAAPVVPPRTQRPRHKQEATAPSNAETNERDDPRKISAASVKSTNQTRQSLSSFSETDDVDYAQMLRTQAKRLGKANPVAVTRVKPNKPQETVATSKPVPPVERYKSRKDAGIIDYVPSRSPILAQSLESLHENQPMLTSSPKSNERLVIHSSGSLDDLNFSNHSQSPELPLPPTPNNSSFMYDDRSLPPPPSEVKKAHREKRSSLAERPTKHEYVEERPRPSSVLTVHYTRQPKIMSARAEQRFGLKDRMTALQSGKHDRRFSAGETLIPPATAAARTNTKRRSVGEIQYLLERDAGQHKKNHDESTDSDERVPKIDSSDAFFKNSVHAYDKAAHAPYRADSGHGVVSTDRRELLGVDDTDSAVQAETWNNLRNQVEQRRSREYRDVVENLGEQQSPPGADERTNIHGADYKEHRRPNKKGYSKHKDSGLGFEYEERHASHENVNKDDDSRTEHKSVQIHHEHKDSGIIEFEQKELEAKFGHLDRLLEYKYIEGHRLGNELNHNPRQEFTVDFRSTEHNLLLLRNEGLKSKVDGPKTISSDHRSPIPVESVLQISHKRQKSNDEIECDKAIQSLTRYLAPVVSLPQAVIYSVNSGAITTPAPDPHSVDLLPSSSPYWASPRAAVLESRMRTQTSADAEMDDGEDSEILLRKKEELINRIKTKVEIMKTARCSLQDDVAENERLGQQVTSMIEEKPLTSRELEKYNSYINELDKIMNLLLKLGGRLARAENAVLSLSKDASSTEKRALVLKRDRLQEQHEDAKKLREAIEKRSLLVSASLQNYLTDDEYSDYLYFVKRKAELIREEQEMSENIELGEEQLKALQLSMRLACDNDDLLSDC